MKILTAIPCFDHMDVAFAQTIADYQKVNNDKTDIVYHSGSLIYEARNLLMKQAMSSDYDYVMWIDSDMLFAPTILNELLANNKDFVTGLYFNRRPPNEPCIFKTVGYTRGKRENEVVPYAQYYYDYPKNSVFEIDACGFGAVLTSVPMLRRMYENKGNCFSPKIGFGEDISFCINAQESGYTLYCDSKVKFGHISKCVIDEETYSTREATDVSSN